ncbi:hypothetical protein KBX37_10700 [Micromonospora sp. U56]|uniref:trehalase-like domain-containing protein n=1 Tax=Micromonospora sp. U56 TaxID=2824900 RepID=UPI001B37DF8A|nr:trehalase-like domain-containing protein [Micromonospora sp. U56]MBQ0893556.1 hypothetical protein [Micromonospora sp. U56]
MSVTEIADHGLLADGQSAALVDRDGSVNWWCPGRFDGPAVFGRLLDHDAGHWSLRPEGDFTSERAYVTDSLVLRTVFTTATGAVAVTDGLALEPGARGHRVGRHSPRVLARVVQGSPARCGSARSSGPGSSTAGWSRAWTGRAARSWPPPARRA